jgi:hemolysin D
MSLKHRIEAYAGLLNTYRAIFAHHWRHRHQLSGKLLTENEAEFLPAALSLQEKPVSPAARLVAFILITLVIVLILWSIIGKVDIIVNATGKIIPSDRTKTIASIDVASVKALHVQEGQTVKAGDVLIELDASAFNADRDKAAGDQVEASLQVARSRALIAAVNNMKPPQLPAIIPGIPDDKLKAAQLHLEGQYRDYCAKLQHLEEEIHRCEQDLPLSTQRAHDYQELAKDHSVSQHAYFEKEQARIDLEGQLAGARSQRAALIEETKRVAYEALTEGGKLAAESRQDALRSGSHSRLLKLTAPVDGTVQQLTVHTVGGVVPAAQPLMMIVPRQKLVEVEAFMENKDIGFVEEGQPAEVKIDAFEYTKYGTIPGRVTHVSRDAIQDEKKGLIYSVKVVLDKSSIFVEGHDMPLSAGMSANVEIKTGTRRVIEYVLSPLLQHRRESLNER